MFSFKHLTIITFLISSALSLSIRGQNDGKSFTLHQVRSSSSAKSRAAVSISTYDKFNKRASSDTVAATPSTFDGYYLAPVTVGGQTLNLQIDTGSDSLWILSSSLVSSASKNSLSTISGLQQGQTWETCYGDQTCAAGDVYTESVSIGDITVDNQTVGAATKASSSFRIRNGFDGILGLSFYQDGMGIPQYTPFFDNIKATLSAPLFTADLKKGKPGSYDFGFIDDSKHTGSIIYVPVDKSQGFWGFTVNGYGIGTDNFNSITVNVIADTGTTLIYLPEQIVNAYYASVSDAIYSSTEVFSGYIFPCGTTLPSITFGIGNYNAVVPGSFVEHAPAPEDQTACVGSIQPGDGSGSFILGDVFLKSQFVVFDAGNEPRLGFAAKPL